RRMLDIDYDVYADGEAELGWLNSSFRVTSGDEFSLDGFLLELVARLRDSLNQLGAETAHLKTIGLWEGFFGVANLISSDSEPELSLPSNCDVKEADMIVNARVACNPQVLEERVKAAIDEVCRRRNAVAEFRQTQSFSPGRPVPTHRFETAK
ncbi:MAG: cobalamin biosynthesis protein P47K, partial [Planctomycetaceae bacterium]